MAAECLVITILLLFVIFGFMKSRRKKWAAAVLPLIVVPLANGLSKFFITDLLGLEFTFVLAVGVVVTALVASCTWIGFVSALVLQKKRSRITYMSITILFDILLSIILVNIYYQLMG